MNRAERRHRTEKIAKKRFRQLYCNFKGTPKPSFWRYRTEKEAAILYGMCRSGVNNWRCRCDYCMGRVFREQDIADLSLMEGLQEAVELYDCKILVRNERGFGSTGPYDWGHEKWGYLRAKNQKYNFWRRE